MQGDNIYWNELLLDQVGWQNFCREVTIMQKLNHKNVIKMHTLFQTDTQYHIVLDLSE